MKKSRAFFLFIPALIIALIVIAGYSAGTKRNHLPMERTTIVIASDLHYLAPELTDHGAFFQKLTQSGDGKAMKYCEELTDAFIEHVMAQKPDALILSGDLTFNGAKLSHTSLAAKLTELTNAGIRVLVLPGNHDLENPSAAAFHGDGYTLADSISARQFTEIYGAFGPGDALSRDRVSLSYVAELKPGLRILMLDVNQTDSPGTVKDETLAWVKSQLLAAERDGCRVVAVSHQNLLRHNSLFSYGFVMDNNELLLGLYEQYGVICNLSGHMHIQHIAESEHGLPEIAASALIISPNQMGILTLEGKTGEYHTENVSVQLSDNTDFSGYTHDFLWETAYRQAAEELPASKELAGFYADISTAYASGRMDTAIWNDELLRQWKEQSPFMHAYLQSLFNDGFKNYTDYKFSIYR